MLALALLHHLLVAGNLSLEAICEMLAASADRDLVLEFIPTDDGMFRRLLKFRVNLFRVLRCGREAFGKRFSLLKEEPIPHSRRTLLFSLTMGINNFAFRSAKSRSFAEQKRLCNSCSAIIGTAIGICCRC